MLQKIIRISGGILSVLFLIGSIGIIYWISRDEQERLVLKERAGLVDDNAETRAQEKKAKEDAVAELEVVDRSLHDIDALMATIANDDLPSE